MKKLFTIIALCTFTVFVQAQDNNQPVEQMVETTIENVIDYESLSFLEILGDYVVLIKDYTVTGVEFVAEQAPLVVQEFLAFMLIKEIIHTILAFIILVGLIIYLIHFIKKKYDWDGGEIFVGIILLISIVIFTSITIDHIIEVVKISVAPRIYLIEYVAELYANMNGGSGCNSGC